VGRLVSGVHAAIALSSVVVQLCAV
jgi:hypothetical protein